MIFSTSAGRIVFEAYKKESPLPEDMADANGHEGTATFLRAITKRYICCLLNHSKQTFDLGAKRKKEFKRKANDVNIKNIKAAS